MTQKEIENIIRNEIKESPIDNWHGISRDNIENHIIEPLQKKYIDSWTKGIVIKWLVLDESRENKNSGYQIVFDDKTLLFGLAVKGGKNSEGIGTYIGDYGSFLETLNGM